MQQGNLRGYAKGYLVHLGGEVVTWYVANGWGAHAPGSEGGAVWQQVAARELHLAQALSFKVGRTRKCSLHLQAVAYVQLNQRKHLAAVCCWHRQGCTPGEGGEVDTSSASLDTFGKFQYNLGVNIDFASCMRGVHCDQAVHSLIFELQPDIRVPPGGVVW